MKNLENSILINSIKSNLSPQDEYEQFEVIHTGLKLSYSVEELINKIIEYKSQGYTSLKFISTSKDTQVVELQKSRSPEELIQYKIDRIEHKILRWLADGNGRFEKILKDKEYSIVNYKNRINELEIRKIKVSNEMKEILTNKEQRYSCYQEKIKEIKHVINNYEYFTYEELCALPEKYFTRGGSLK